MRLTPVQRNIMNLIAYRGWRMVVRTDGGRHKAQLVSQSPDICPIEVSGRTLIALRRKGALDYGGQYSEFVLGSRIKKQIGL